jgi:hypothetical protein
MAGHHSPRGRELGPGFRGLPVNAGGGGLQSDRTTGLEVAETVFSAMILLFFAQVELQIMARLSHPNIVRVYGGCLTPPNLFVVSELMVGDLSNRIHSKEDGNQSDTTSGSVPAMNLRQALLAALDIIRALVSMSPSPKQQTVSMQPCTLPARYTSMAWISSTEI